MGAYDNNMNEYASLYNGARGVYHIVKTGVKSIAKGIKKAVSSSESTPKPNVPVGQRTQNLEVPPKTTEQKNAEYKAAMDQQYGSGFSSFVNKMFGGKI